MDTLLHIMLVVTLGITGYFVLSAYDNVNLYSNPMNIVVFRNFSNFVVYFTGFLTGFVVARIMP